MHDVCRRCVLLTLVLGLAHPDVTFAQWRPVSAQPFALAQPVSVELSPQVVAVPQRSIAASIVIAATGSVLGAIAGGFLGYHIDRARDVPSEDPGLGGLIFGGLAGSAIGAPLLLYVANDRTGSLGSATLLSAAATAVTASAFWDDGSFFMLAPIVQVGISVAFLH